MQPALAPLPKFPALGHQTEAAPMRRPGRIEQKLRAVFGSIGYQHAAAADDLALRTGPGTNPGVKRAAGKVSIAFLGADLFDTAFDAHHALELHPVKLQGREWIACQLPSLAAVVIGVPDNAAFVIAFDQHYARAGPQVFAHGCHGHGVGLWYLGTDSLLQPLIELLQGIGVGSGFAQLCAFIAFAQIGNG